jgi:hypothetical protein
MVAGNALEFKVKVRLIPAHPGLFRQRDAIGRITGVTSAFPMPEGEVVILFLAAVTHFLPPAQSRSRS